MIKLILNKMKEHHLIVSKEDEIIFRYGLELLLNALISVSILLIMGTLLGYLKETVIFYLTYLFLKKNTGGYHAQSHVGCILQFNLFCLILFLIYKYGMLPICEAGILTLLGISVFFFAPLEDKNKKVTDEQLQMHKRSCRAKLVLITAFCLCLKIFHIEQNSLYDFFYLGLLMVSITILLGALKKHITKDGIDS